MSSFFLIYYFFIFYFIWVCWVLVAAHGIFVALGRIFQSMLQCMDSLVVINRLSSCGLRA